MRLGFRVKLFVALIGLVVVSFFGADLYLARALEAQLGARIQEDALVRLRLVERDASSFDAPLDDLAAWDRLADDLGARAQARITLIRLDGKVIGDSEVALSALAGVASHADRPEVRAALATGQGESERVSATVHEPLAYYAVPFRHAGEIAGTVRIATSLVAIDQAVSHLHSVVLASSLVACVAAALLSFFVAHSMSAAARKATRAARRMAAGDLEARARLDGADEIAQLGGALDQLAASLSGAMADLRRERDLLIAIFDGMEEGVLVLDGDGRVVRVNAALRRMLLLGSDVLGRPLLETVRNAELHEVIAAARTEPATGEIGVAGIKPRRLQVRAAPLGGPSDARVVVVRDVTDVRRLETMRRDFVANVSHELRTPVTSVLSAAETLRGALSADPAAAARFLDIIDRNAERLQRLIEDLLDLSRIESKELKLRLESVDLGQLVGHVLALHAQPARTRGVQLCAEVPRGLATRADRRALEQVIGNLVENAVKYCPGARVTVRASEAADGRVALDVADGGPGIPEVHLPRIFERFYRVDAGRSRDLGGTGLGLSIVKHLSEAMGGRVEVTSRVGEGTTFTVTLPAADARAVDAVAPP